METFTVLLFSLLSLIANSLESKVQAVDSSSYFRGAVIEYGPKFTNTSSKETVLLNLESYKNMVQQLKRLHLPPEIIVFPECGLTHYKWVVQDKFKIFAEKIPDPHSDVVPCAHGDSVVIKKLSCIAKNNSVYMVVNVLEKVEENQTILIYNTNVIYDRKGALIGRYRKYNVFGQDGAPISKPKLPDFVYFDTDFGVRFGTFTCFDIIFKTPAIDLVNHYNVTHIAFPSAWFSEQPFLTAVQEQAAWAFGTKAVLLASGYNDPEHGSSGSGIYFHNGAKNKVSERSLQIQESHDFAIVSWIPKSTLINESQFFDAGTKIEFFKLGELADAYLKLKTDKLDVYTTKLLNDTNKQNETIWKDSLKLDDAEYHYKKSKYNETVCDRGLCCEFSFVKTTKFCIDFSDPYILQGDEFGFYKYRFAVFNGVRTYDGVTTGGVQICSVISCLDDKNINSCGKYPGDNNIKPDEYISESGIIYRKCGSKFDNVVIKADLKYHDDSTFVTANILVSSSEQNNTSLINLMRYGSIISPDTYSITKTSVVDNWTASFEFRTNEPINDPLSFNIYNRIFDLDTTPMTQNNNSRAPESIFNYLQFFSIIVTFFIIYYVSAFLN